MENFPRGSPGSPVFFPGTLGESPAVPLFGNGALLITASLARPGAVVAASFLLLSLQCIACVKRKRRLYSGTARPGFCCIGCAGCCPAEGCLPPPGLARALHAALAVALLLWMASAAASLSFVLSTSGPPRGNADPGDSSLVASFLLSPPSAYRQGTQPYISGAVAAACSGAVQLCLSAFACACALGWPGPLISLWPARPLVDAALVLPFIVSAPLVETALATLAATDPQFSARANSALGPYTVPSPPGPAPASTALSCAFSYIQAVPAVAAGMAACGVLAVLVRRLGVASRGGVRSGGGAGCTAVRVLVVAFGFGAPFLELMAGPVAQGQCAASDSVLFDHMAGLEAYGRGVGREGSRLVAFLAILIALGSPAFDFGGKDEGPGGGRGSGAFPSPSSSASSAAAASAGMAMMMPPYTGPYMAQQHGFAPGAAGGSGGGGFFPQISGGGGGGGGGGGAGGGGAGPWAGGGGPGGGSDAQESISPLAFSSPAAIADWKPRYR